MLVPAIVIITLALVFYTVGVWGERVQGTLKPWHAGMFALGLACDATGTWLMTQITAERRGEGIQPGALSCLDGGQRHHRDHSDGRAPGVGRGGAGAQP